MLVHKELFETLLANLQQAWARSCYDLLRFSSCQMRQAASAAGQMSQDTRKEETAMFQHGPCEDYPCSDLLPEWAAPHSWRLQAWTRADSFLCSSAEAAASGGTAAPRQRGRPASRMAASFVPGQAATQLHIARVA